MDTIDWLRKHAPGFQCLSDDERQAIYNFSLLWSLFEAKALNEHGSANAIIESAKRWARSGQLSADTFTEELAYFRERYVADGAFTCHFDHLHLPQNDARRLVQKVLNREDAEPGEAAAAVLIIAYRFRNNLFHGVKWSYKLQGQLDNFTHANTILMRAIELDDKMEPGRHA